MKARQCSLCEAAEAQPHDVKIFFLRDKNPAKSHRWLALPRAHWAANHELSEMAAAGRTGSCGAPPSRKRRASGETSGESLTME